MYIKRVINRSGTTSVIVAEKVRGANKHLKTIGVMFYDVTTLYFETDHEDGLRKTGFLKEGRHSIIKLS